MAVKLYPPVIAGTIPAFYTDKNGATKIVVPFSMNRAVGTQEFNGLALKIKKVSGTLIGVIRSSVYEITASGKVTFDISHLKEELLLGEYYKIQIAYLSDVNNMGSVGYYSTVGVIKYTSKPEVTIEGLETGRINNHLYNYTGVYRQAKTEIQEDVNSNTIFIKYNTDLYDTTEKIYSSRFELFDGEGNIIRTSGEILHNTSADSLSYECDESYLISDDLDLNVSYYIQYIVTTTNGMEVKSPKYRIRQRRQIPMNLEAHLSVELNYDKGVTEIYLVADEGKENTVASGYFLLSRRGDDTNEWHELQYFSLQSELPTRLLFTDYTIAQGITYEYSIQQYNTHGVYSDRKISNSVYADFEDLFLYDGKRQLKVRFNPKVSSLKNNVVENKVDTIGSKYPFITRNGHVNYKELSIAGLISYQMDDMETFYPLEDLGFVPSELSKVQRGQEEAAKALTYKFPSNQLTSENLKAERLFKLDVLDWLTNGEAKLFRSPTEGNYIVRLMGASLSPVDTVGRMLHSFTCSAYEIADYNYKSLNQYGLIDLEENVRFQMRWATKRLSESDGMGGITYAHGQLNISSFEDVVRPVYSILFTEMQPGTEIRIGESASFYDSFYIGATGSYYVEVNKPYYYVGIPDDAHYDGLLTYGYKSQITTTFNLIEDIEIIDIPCTRFIGNNYKYQNGALQDSDNLFTCLQDVKKTILQVDKINFTLRGQLPIYVKRDYFNENNQDAFYGFSYYKENFSQEEFNAIGGNYKDLSIPYLDEPDEHQRPVLNLEPWNIYKIYFLREDYEYVNVLNEGYYVDANGDKFYPFSGWYYDPLTNRFIKCDEQELNLININGEIADLTETERLEVKGITNYDFLSFGPGVIADISYQQQISTYEFENKGIIKTLKNLYETEVTRFKAPRGATLERSKDINLKYANFIAELTKEVEKYRKENEVG